MIAKSGIFQNENENKYFLIFSRGSIYSGFLILVFLDIPISVLSSKP